ncbi:MAG: helix-turn-helix transcriptional regulator [Candidatus Limnocylindrales bacterium]
MISKISTEVIAAVRLLDEPVRRRLYEWVAAHGRPVGREESATALGIGRALATFHLDRLAESGMLEAGYQRLIEKRGPGAGRPARVYWRAQREFSVSLPERRYDRMAELFATALEGNIPLREVAHSAGQRLGRQAPGRPGARRLLTVLDQGGYEPVTDPAGTIRLRNCPFDALVAEHRPTVCGANLAIAQGISDTAGAGADLTPVLDPRLGYCCVAFKRDLTNTAA